MASEARELKANLEAMGYKRFTPRVKVWAEGEPVIRGTSGDDTYNDLRDAGHEHPLEGHGSLDQPSASSNAKLRVRSSNWRANGSD